MDTGYETKVKALREPIIELLNKGAREDSPELLSLLAEYWEAMRTEFGTKMEPWKAKRIYDIQWNAPVLEFRIERHPGPWDRVQRWSYDFSSDEAALRSEWSPPQNPRYTRKQLMEDARQIVDALLTGNSHPCLQTKGAYYYIRMGRLPQTRPLPYQLPHRTAKGRQARLRAEVARLMETHTEFARVADKETTGSLVYRHP